MTARKRVAIVGLGCVSPVGNNVRDFADAVMSGQSGGGEITQFDASRMQTRIAAEVRDFDLADWFGRNDDGLSSMDRKIQLGAAACEEALEDANISHAAPPPRERQISLGTAASYLWPEDIGEFIAPFASKERGFDHAGFLANSAQQRPNRVSRLLYEEMSTWLSRRANATGGAKIHYAACAASSQAIGQGMELIRSGRAKLVITGGFDSMINPIGLNSFIRLGALTRRNATPLTASRPFDKTRDGFLIGEGAAVLVLEEWESAVENGRNIYGELAGYGSSLDAHHITAPDPKAVGARLSMERALRDARVEAADIGYVNAHGTSTALNDPMEALAIHQVFGPRGGEVPVSSSKSMFGHLIATAGAAELIATLVGMRRNKLPPTINLDEPGPDCELNHVAGQARDAEFDLALSNSFAFGGQNATLVLRKAE